jgi:cytoplasmic iron level regulating protein YaaA (DUF328/UPF0246 family)
MLAILSPAKKLDMDSSLPTSMASSPQFLKEVKELVEVMRGKTQQDLEQLMDISATIAALNVERFRTFSFAGQPEHTRPAVLAFAGDVYTHLDAASLKEQDYSYAQSHLRILSGLYGVLRPMDLIQPYRLEMGVPLKTAKGKDLYAYWKEKATGAINAALKESGGDLLVNLASEEYAKVLDRKKVKGRVLDITFKEERNGVLKNYGILAKRARGMMARYLITERVETIEGIKAFREGGYAYVPELSNGEGVVFVRG